MSRIVDIIKMPSKGELNFCLHERPSRTQLPAVFTLNDGTQTWTEEVKLDSCRRSDMSGLAWIYKGHNVANNCKVTIRISFKDRKGTMAFLSKGETDDPMRLVDRIILPVDELSKLSSGFWMFKDVTSWLAHAHFGANFSRWFPEVAIGIEQFTKPSLINCLVNQRSASGAQIAEMLGGHGALLELSEVLCILLRNDLVSKINHVFFVEDVNKMPRAIRVVVLENRDLAVEAFTLDLMVLTPGDRVYPRDLIFETP